MCLALDCVSLDCFYAEIVFLQSFAAPVSYSETGTEHLDDADSDTVFIVEEFAGPVFETLRNEECRIIAPPVVIRAAVNNEVLDFMIFFAVLNSCSAGFYLLCHSVNLLCMVCVSELQY